MDREKFIEGLKKEMWENKDYYFGLMLHDLSQNDTVSK